MLHHLLQRQFCPASVRKVAWRWLISMDAATPFARYVAKQNRKPSSVSIRSHSRRSPVRRLVVVTRLPSVHRPLLRAAGALVEFPPPAPNPSPAPAAPPPTGGPGRSAPTDRTERRSDSIVSWHSSQIPNVPGFNRDKRRIHAGDQLA